jgi:hypothetical protein
MANLRDVWRRWRERSRQHAIDRALYKAGGGRGPRHGGAGGENAAARQDTGPGSGVLSAEEALATAVSGASDGRASASRGFEPQPGPSSGQIGGGIWPDSAPT